MKRVNSTDGPPPKRQNMGSTVAEDGEDSGMGDVQEDELVKFQKHAIWRRMQEYKREFERASERIQDLEQNRLTYEKRAALFCESLAMVSEDIGLTLTKLKGKLPNLSNPDASEWLKKLMTIESSHEHQIDDIRKTLAEQLSQIVSIASAGSNATSSDNIDTLQARCHTLASQNAALIAEVTKKSERLKTLEEELDEVKAARVVVERRLDRARSSISAAGPATAAEKSTPTERDGHEDSSSAFDSRLKEIEELKAEKLDLMQKMDALRIQLSQGSQVLSDERVRESALYQNLEAEFHYHKSENACLKGRIDKVLEDYESLVSERRKFVEQCEADEAGRRKALEAEIKRLENDLTRIRGLRDTLQHNMELRNAKDGVELAQNQEIKVIANSRKDRIAFLEGKLDRLKLRVASEMPDIFWLEFFSENPDGNPFEELRKELKIAQEKARDLEDQVLASKQALDGSLSIEELLVSENRLKEEVHSLKSKLHACESGAHAELEEKIKELHLKIEYHKKTESRLLVEIETIGKAWAELEGEKTKKAVVTADRDEQLMRLTAEKAKVEYKCQMLAKQSSTANNLNIALKRQSEKQLEQIRKLEDREKSLMQQLQTLEKDFSAKTIASDLHRRRVAELTQQKTEMMDKLEKMSLKYQEIEKLLREKNKALVDEGDVRRRLAEQNESLKRKLEIQVKNESGSELQKENEAMKIMLKCPSCQINFWDHCLVRCKHVFCQKCIEDQVNARSRKCPTCYQPFSANDAIKLYKP
ncbi:E3 ubiquitin-protein ligase bre1 [Phlyctochytrium planicorne]|nr:E3 ubiquitin-protein ligase bre1 [Phlyctochytrium planicorne]